MRREIAAGLRYVTGHRWLRSIAATTGTSNLFSNIGGAILLLWLTTDHHFSAAQLGFAFSLGSFGVLGAALTASRISRWLGVGRTLVISSIGFSVSALPLVLAPPDLIFAAVAGSILLGSYSGVVWNINQVSLRQAITPTRMQGKMNATMRFIVWGTIPVGMIAGGFLGGVIGLFPTIVVGAVGSLFTFLPVALSPVRQLREMPEQVGDEGDGAVTEPAGA
jgi:MFS family permease